MLPLPAGEENGAPLFLNCCSFGKEMEKGFDKLHLFSALLSVNDINVGRE